jgi:hypothetical protein
MLVLPSSYAFDARCLSLLLKVKLPFLHPVMLIVCCYLTAEYCLPVKNIVITVVVVVVADVESVSSLIKNSKS